MQRKPYLLAICVLVALLLAACGGAQSTSTTSTQAANAATTVTTSAGVDSDGDSIPDSAETLLATNPNDADTDGDGIPDLEDQEPTTAPNPITETSTTIGFSIDSILVENNLNPSGGGDAPDHLELAVSNSSGADLSNFVIYYTITDTTTSLVQSYYRTLPNFALASGETKVLHLDNSGEVGHYSVNPNSLYYTDTNALVFEVTLYTEGFAPVIATITKDAGGAEAPD